MADNSSIEWTDATWNPVTGCSLASPGCINCYAMRLAGTRLRNHPSRRGLTVDTKTGPVWTGEIRFNEQWLDQPRRWRRPRRIFVCAHGDLFAEGVTDLMIDRVLAVMSKCPHHIFQVLTKRPARMDDYLGDPGLWPLPNVWLGTSIEDQRRADERRPPMRRLADAGWLTWVSYEPALGPVDWSGWEFLSWLVAGGESGPRARHEDHAWYRATLEWCRQTDSAFFMKQLQAPNKPGKVWTLKESFPDDLQVQEYPTEAFNG